MRWQLAIAPEVHPGPALVHPVTDARVPVAAAFLDVLPFAQRPFTARELVERSGAPLSSQAVEQTLRELRAAGLVIPASTAAERVARGALNPLRALAVPAVGLPLLVLGAAAVAAQLQSILFFSTRVLTGLRGALVVPFVIAVIAVPAARALFRAQLLQGTARRVKARLHGVIPTWELEHPLPSSRAGQWLAHSSGFLFDVIVINACVLTMRAKPFELGYAGIETPVAFLVVTASLSLIAANPLAKYDVYFALEHALGVADLRGHARARFFQILSRRRVDVSTALYAAYFAASVAYSLFISLGLLFVAYGLASQLFPADPPVRIGLATVLVGTVFWRAVRTIHRPVVRALAARRRKESTTAHEGALDLPPSSATLSTSLHASEGFPFSFALVESVDERMHDFAALADKVEVHVVRRDAVAERELDLDEPPVRALSLRMFAQPPRALGESEQQALVVAWGAQKKLALDRYEPLPWVSVVDGTFKHGSLDVAARMRSSSELDIYRALFAPLRSRHVVERDRIAVAFRDKAAGRFTHFVLLDDNDAAGLRLRIQGLRRSLDRADPRAIGGLKGAAPLAPSAHASPAAVPSSSSSSPASSPASSSTPLTGLNDGRPRVRAVLDALRAASASAGDATALSIAARLRKSSPELLATAGCVAVLRPFDVDALAKASAEVREWALAAGLVFEETRDGRTALATQIRAPTLVIPTGPASSPTGLKLRLLVDEPFEPSTRWAVPLARYEFLSPHRNFLSRSGPDGVVDVAYLPVWIGEGGAGDSVFVFDGELKAMACRHLLDLPALSTGGFNHPFQAALAKHLAERREPTITFVLDDEAPVYRRGRTDQLLDPVVRTLQLAHRTRALRPSAKLLLMRGLSVDGKKLDLDEVAGLTGAARDEALRNFRAHTAEAIDASTLLSSAAGPYVAELCTFSDRFYGALDDVKRARARGSSSEVRALAQALNELADSRKKLHGLASAARDEVMRALKPRSRA